MPINQLINVPTYTLIDYCYIEYLHKPSYVLKGLFTLNAIENGDMYTWKTQDGKGFLMQF